MLRKAKDLERYKVRATDGEIGDVDEFYFDDEAWTLRYLVVETGSWLDKRRVLIAPESFGLPDWPIREFPVELTREQVKDSHPIDTDSRFGGSTSLTTAPISAGLRTGHLQQDSLRRASR